VRTSRVRTGLKGAPRGGSMGAGGRSGNHEMARLITQRDKVLVRSLSLDAVLDRITEVSSLPHVAMKAMEVAGDPEAAAADLKSVVERDPSLCSRLLRQANSAAHGLRAKITNVQQAISYLGFRQIRNLAVTAWVCSIFQEDDAIGPYQRTKLWRHMVAVGVCARLIAKRLKLAANQDAYLGGLLHDIGIVLADQYAHDGFRVVIERLRDDRSLAEVEREHLGFDHTVLGARVGEKWGFPDLVQDAIRFHHASQLCHGEHPEIVQCVEIANVICTLKGLTSVGRKLIRAPRAAMEALGLDMSDVAVLAAELDDELATNESLFELWDMSDVQPLA
jgi:putative nucleotidyltransferase with HDIG domain